MSLASVGDDWLTGEWIYHRVKAIYLRRANGSCKTTSVREEDEDVESWMSIEGKFIKWRNDGATVHEMSMLVCEAAAKKRCTKNKKAWHR
jgi:hypothetical protein